MSITMGIDPSKIKPSHVGRVLKALNQLDKEFKWSRFQEQKIQIACRVSGHHIIWLEGDDQMMLDARWKQADKAWEVAPDFIKRNKRGKRSSFINYLVGALSHLNPLHLAL